MSTYLIANFDRKEYLRPEAFGEKADLRSVVDSYEGVMTGLAVLLADGNNRGGGDLSSDDEIIGTWGGNRIAIIDDQVVSAEFSEPGMEEVPLQRQLLSLGNDVSQKVINAINVAESEVWAVGSLNPNHVLSLVQQRELPQRGAKFLLSAMGRKSRLEQLEDLFAVFGVGAGLSPYMACKRMQEGVDKMAKLFGRSERWTITRFAFSHGMKPVRVSEWSNDMRPGDGIVKVAMSAFEAASPGDVQEFEVRFDMKGATVEAIYNWFFPGIVFERAPQLADSVKSKEVAKLLSMVQKNMEG
jgi:hypothetical protein